MTAAVPVPTRAAEGRRADGLPAVCWTLLAGLTLWRSGAVVSPFLTLLLTGSEHLSTGTAADVVAAFGAGWTAGACLSGWLTDRAGARTAISVGLTVTAACYLAVPRTHSLAGLVVEMTVIGLCFDSPRPALAAWVADLVPEDRRSRAYGRLNAASNLGSAVAGAVGGYLASRHVGLIFALDAVACLLFTVLVLVLPLASRSPDAQRPTDGAAASWRAVLADRRLLAITALTLGVLIVYQQWGYGVPLAMRAQELPTSAFGSVAVVNGAVVLIAQPLLQRWIDRVHPLTSCAAAALVMGGGMACNGLAHSTAAFTAAAALWTPGEILLVVAGNRYVAALAPALLRGRYLGLWSGAVGASALASPLLGAAALRAGTGLLWLSCAAVGAMGAAGCLVLARADRTRPQEIH